MNLAKLFEAQRKLDEHIEREHPRKEGEDRLAKKILALMVELGELCQEWRGFKFWSNDQEPRTRHVEPDIEHFDKTREARWKESNPLLEEYVDCLHFILSIGLELNMPVIYDTEIKWDELTSHKTDITQQFLLVFEMVTNLAVHSIGWMNLFEEFYILGEMLGFTWEQVEEAYFQKNAINHERQENGY